MAWTVVALFDVVSNAQRAVEELLNKGLSSQDISVVRPVERSGRRTDLADLGVAEKDVPSYMEGIQNGGTLISVRASESEYAGIMVILNNLSAVDVAAHPTPPERSGTTSAKTNQDPYTSVYGRRFEDFEGDFKKDWEARYDGEGDGYERYRPAYQYGWNAYNLFGSRGWEAIESELAADWLHSHPSDAWRDFRDAARVGWESCKRGAPASGREAGQDAGGDAGG